MNLSAAIVLAAIGLLSAPAALRAGGWRRRRVRFVALFATAGLACVAVLALLAPGGSVPAPVWLVAGGAVLAAAGTGGLLTVAVLSSAPIVGDAAAAHPWEEPSETAALADPGAQLLRGGALIGLFERIAVAGTLLASWPEGVAIVLAVKGLGRYPELKALKPGLSERFILGTFVSVLVAAACAGLGLLLIS